MKSVKRMRGTWVVGSRHRESKLTAPGFARQGYRQFARAGARESDYQQGLQLLNRARECIDR
jgi:hypothetical protein